MSSKRPPYVTLTGDRTGNYVVVEERPDGSLVLVPEGSKGSRRAQRRIPEAGNTLLSGMLFTSKQPPATIPAALDEWGAELGDDEFVREFLVADVDGRAGFVAVTSQRMLFLVKVGRELGIAREQLLSSACGVDLVRRGMGHKLRLRWEGSEMLIGASDRGSLARLQQALAVQNR